MCSRATGTGIGAKRIDTAVERRPAPVSIDEYIAGFPAETQCALQQLRTMIRAAAPDATEKISYGIPAFDLAGRHVVFFAAYARHIGIYPIRGAVAEALGEELRPFRSGKSTARFPLDRPLPLELIRKIVECMAAGSAGEGP
jgi:uncharacterized protein YdhG (YjbR/CyaY superfamily)